MTAVQRVGDANSGGGVITAGAASVLVNGRPVAVTGMPVTPHYPCGRRGGSIHCSAVTVGSSGSVMAEGKPIVLTGDVDTCGHVRVGGSADVGIK